MKPSLKKASRILKSMQPTTDVAGSEMILPNTSNVQDSARKDRPGAFVNETDFTAGSILFRGTNKISEDNAKLFWNNTNKFLGIGTNNPQKPLHISGGNNHVGMYFTYGATDYRNSIENTFSAGAAASNYQRFLICNSSTTGQVEALRLYGTGAVHIPSADLYVTGGNIRSKAGHGMGFGLWGTTPNTYGMMMSNAAQYNYGSVTDYKTVYTMSSGVNRGFVWSYGNAPSMSLCANSGNLKLKGKLDLRQGLISGGSDTLGAGALSIGSDNPYWFLRGTATALQDLAFDRFYGGNYYEALRIQRSTGNVGIGTTTPGSKLHVAGTDGIIVPVGTTAQRVATQGMIRYNTTTSKFEGYDGSNWHNLH